MSPCARSLAFGWVLILTVAPGLSPVPASAADLFDDPSSYQLLSRPLLSQAPAQPQAPASQEPERPKPVKPQEQLLLERGAILLRQGTLQIEPSIDYAHFSSDRVAVSGFTIFEAIVIGTIRVDKLDRDLVTGALTTRLGIFDRLQVDARVPYVYRHDRETLGVGISDRERDVEGSGIGDVEASVLGQVLIGTDVLPDVILKLRARFPTGRHPFEVKTETDGNTTRLKEVPTGNGFYTVNPGVTLVWRTDPVVFFLGGSYSLNLERDFGSRFGKVDPGDTIEFFAGLNMAVSDRVAINMSFVDQITGSTRQNGDRRSGTSFTDARLILGSSVALRPNTSFLLAVGAGLTRESPDYTVTISLPISFSLF